MNNLPVIYPNETIFSWLTRAFLLSGYVNSKVYCSRVFNTAKVRIHPYLNNRLTLLATQSLYTESELLNHHTLYPIFNTFALQVNQEKLKSKLLSNDILAVSSAGMTQFNYPIFHGHKYCPICVIEDIKKCGCGYWHIEHQIPGICSCNKHNVLLHGIAAGEHQLDKKLILPPKNMQILPSSFDDNKLACFSASLLESLQQPNVQFNYLQEYNHQLSNKGLLSNKGQLRNIKIVQELKEYWATLSTYSSNELSVSDDLLKFEYIGRLYRCKEHYSSHPLKHLLFMCWLFDSDSNHLFKGSQYEERVPNQKSTKNNCDEKIIEMIRNGDSYNNIYRQTGRSRCYIKRLASMNNISRITISTKIDRVMMRKILMKAILGQHRLLIAEKFDISIGSVEQIISSEPALVAWRKYLRYQNKKSLYFEEITSFLTKNHNCHRKDVKEKCNAAFFWCFLNEKEWLNAILPKAMKPIRQQCDWRSRDNEAVIKINGVVSKSTRTISITKLDNLIGGKRWLTRFIDKLPKSKYLIYLLIKDHKLFSRTPEKYLK